MTIRELLFEKLPVKIDCNVGRQGRSQEAEDSEKQRWKIGTQPDGTSRLGLGPPNVLLLLGTNGAQTKRVRVLIGSQLIGTAQIKRAEILRGSLLSPGNEVIHIDPLNEGIHGDENDVCLLLTTAFRHYCHLHF